jgi:Polysaccharide deacetylase
VSHTAVFTISLDFELHWGVADTKSIQDYKKNLDNTRAAIAQMLALFAEKEIHVTWATVGLLCCENKQQIESLLANSPHLPSYENGLLNNYRLLPNIGENYLSDPYHYGTDILPQIFQTPFQEFATHTFSHFYCLEKGQTVQQFDEDLKLALSMAKVHKQTVTSIVFPRNQYNETYLNTCQQLGITAYRGNETHWIYESRSGSNESLFRRALRLVDTYIPISGYHIHSLQTCKRGQLLNIPSSRFLRPYSEKLRLLEKLKLFRIKQEMTKAAKQNKLYHIWWHPHNFGNDVQKNLQNLTSIIEHFLFLKKTYGMRSLNMQEIYEQQSTRIE